MASSLFAPHREQGGKFDIRFMLKPLGAHERIEQVGRQADHGEAHDYIDEHFDLLKVIKSLEPRGSR
jgi:hypothetical protein